MTLTSEYRHNPVLLAEVLETMQPEPGDVICDCTLGGAGHSIELGRRIAPDGLLLGIDQDYLALEVAGERIASALPGLATMQLKGDYAQMDRLLVEASVPGVDGFLFDLGVSSPQLDIPERGFSYNEDAPLDMRMDPGNRSVTAAEVIAAYTEEDLARIIQQYGEERFARRIAARIVEMREHTPIETTFQLVDIIKSAIPAATRRTGGHPARRTFQAIRIEVNHELESLESGLTQAITWANPGAVICVISYHSLEDKVVKRLFKEFARTCTCPPDLPICACGTVPVIEEVIRKPLVPTAREIVENPRARSAKLRAVRKL